MTISLLALSILAAIFVAGMLRAAKKSSEFNDEKAFEG